MATYILLHVVSYVWKPNLAIVSLNTHMDLLIYRRDCWSKKLPLTIQMTNLNLSTHINEFLLFWARQWFWIRRSFLASNLMWWVMACVHVCVHVHVCAQQEVNWKWLLGYTVQHWLLECYITIQSKFYFQNSSQSATHLVGLTLYNFKSVFLPVFHISYFSIYRLKNNEKILINFRKRCQGECW